MSCADAIIQRLVLETCTQQPQRVVFKSQASTLGSTIKYEVEKSKNNKLCKLVKRQIKQ